MSPNSNHNFLDTQARSLYTFLSEKQVLIILLPEKSKAVLASWDIILEKTE